MARRAPAKPPAVRRRSTPPRIITVDGPSGAGKSSASRLLAKRLGWRVFETGSLYRAIAWAVLDLGVNPTDRRAVERVVARLPIRLVLQRATAAGDAATWRIQVRGRRLTEQLREEAVTRAASIVAALPAVRERLLVPQRQLARLGRVVMEGRDIGTVVCPAAPVKFFLDAAPTTRGQRRFQEEGARAGSFQQTLSAIDERDRRDQARPIAPLSAAPDAVYIDTTSLTLEEVVDKMMAVLQSRGNLLSFGRLRLSSSRKFR